MGFERYENKRGALACALGTDHCLITHRGMLCVHRELLDNMGVQERVWVATDRATKRIALEPCPDNEPTGLKVIKNARSEVMSVSLRGGLKQLRASPGDATRRIRPIVRKGKMIIIDVSDLCE